MKNKSYHLPHAFMEDTTRRNIAHMTSKSKVYVPCLPVISIVMVVAKDDSKNLWHYDLIWREQNKNILTKTRLTNRSWKVGVDYVTRVHLLEFSPCDNWKAMGKKMAQNEVWKIHKKC